jgi:hypothetical protein
MRLYILTRSAKQHTQVVLDTTLIAAVACLLEVIAGCGILNKRAVYVIASVFNRAEVSKHCSKLIMKSSFNGVIGALLKEWRGCSKKSQCIAQAKSNFFNHCEAQ